MSRPEWAAQWVRLWAEGLEPPVAQLLAMARSGELGRIQQIEGNFSHDRFMTLDAGNWRLNADEAPVGGMTATGIHLTDLATALLGKPRDLRVSCESLSSKIPQGDTTSVHIRFRGGGTAYVSASLAMPFVSRFAVYGSQGWIDIRDKAHVESPAGWINALPRANNARPAPSANNTRHAPAMRDTSAVTPMRAATASRT